MKTVSELSDWIKIQFRKTKHFLLFWNSGWILDLLSVKVYICKTCTIGSTKLIKSGKRLLSSIRRALPLYWRIMQEAKPSGELFPYITEIYTRLRILQDNSALKVVERNLFALLCSSFQKNHFNSLDFFLAWGVKEGQFLKWRNTIGEKL